MLRSLRYSNNIGRQFLSKARLINETNILNAERLSAINRLSINWFHKWNKINEANDLLRFQSLNQSNINFARRFCSLPQHTKIDLPALSPTMKTGSVLTWEKKEGEKLNEGDLLCEIETDKATMGFETPEEGYLAKILIPAGTRDVPIGKLLCIIVENESDVAAFKNFSADGVAAQAAAPAPAAPKAAPAPSAKTTPVASPAPAAPPRLVAAAPAAPSAGGRIIASPLAKKLASEKGVNLATVTGSGPGGRIIAKDVIGAPASATAFPSSFAKPTTPFTDIPLTGMRQTIARRLLESKQTIPHYYLQVDIVVDDIMRVRSKMNDLLADEGIKISVNDFVIKASALACQRVPEVNSSWQETFIRQYNTVDVNVAVSTDAGLIAPIVFNAERKGLREISFDINSLAQKAKSGSLQPQEFQGGTFTVSNLGMFGVKNFAAVINPPQSCILAVGAVSKQVVASGDNGQPKVADVLSVTLSCDHRVVDGAVGAKWLQVFKQYLENPMTMIL